MKYARFQCNSLEELRTLASKEEVAIPLSENLSCLSKPIVVQGREIKNRIVIQPMEGCDANEDGTPSELTCRRYRRFAEGGAGLIWFEAVSTTYEGRASAHQLRLDRKNMDGLRQLVEQMHEIGEKENGFAPLIIMQSTHSGRYSKPHGYPEPRIAYHKPLFESSGPLPEESILTDEELDGIVSRFGEAATIAQEIGFDGIDIKCCHGYLGNELMGAYLREGRYGGSFENRSRFLMEGMRNAKEAAGAGFIITSRLGVYDGFPYPYGFGVRKEDGSMQMDLSEAEQLLRRMQSEFGTPLVNITLGNPYVNPHVNRPFDYGTYESPEHPLTGIARAVEAVSRLQHACSDLPLIASAVSYPHQFSANLAAGIVEQGAAAFAGFGRMAIANPDFPKQIFAGGIDPNKACMTCGQCALKLRSGVPAGCVVRDKEFYKA